ncbi:hypothetical protein B0H19DRAFT_1211516 [Mycena capillaripes]|nr:hypothetical protein B0H19DRAFT_1211516 [Mycena capillaripes]
MYLGGAHLGNQRFDNHIRKFPLTAISVLSPYTVLIISVVLLILFFIKFYVLKLFLLRKVYGTKYSVLDEVSRRGFVNHHIAVTMGDILVISAQMLVGMFIFELIYRTKISPISVVHRMGSILIAQAAIAINIQMNKDSSIEFLLCTVWGPFDIISESLPISPSFSILSCLLYRVYPDSHCFLATLFRMACLTTLLGTIPETITLPFKITTPVLDIAFSAARFHETRMFYRMWRKQEKIVLDQQDAAGTELEIPRGPRAIHSTPRTSAAR